MDELYNLIDENGVAHLWAQLKSIFLKKTDYVDMVGASASTVGVHGLVPAPPIGSQNKVFLGDGSWGDVPGSGDTNVIESISVNGTQQTITNKNVNINVPTVPTNVSSFTNDSGYQTASDVSTAISTAMTSALKPGGTVTFANLPSLTAAHLGYFYNVSDAFTTTSDFIEGSGKTIPAGTNVGIIDAGSVGNPNYKYDASGGYVDLSGYVPSSDIHILTNEEIDALLV